MGLDFLWYPLSFLLMLGLVVSVHEFGHFIVARWCGVRVIRFAVGFGKPLLSRYDKRGTEFCVCAIPLGGYVRLLDSRQDEITKENLHEDFSRLPVMLRIAVYSAGPIINFLLAILLFVIYAHVGFVKVPAVVGIVEAGSIAMNAGLRSDDEILEIQGRSVESWEESAFAFIQEAGNTGEIVMRVSRIADERRKVLDLSLEVHDFMSDSGASPLETLGIVPKYQLLPARLGPLVPEDPADQAGWQQGDLILTLDQQEVKYWVDLYDYVRAHPGQMISFSLERDGTLIEGEIVPRPITLDADRQGAVETVGRIGASPQPLTPDSPLVREVRIIGWDGVIFGIEQTWIRLKLVVIGIGKLLVGALALDNLTGPVTIAEIAGKTAQGGLSSSLNFIAYLSISLGVFNLLPVPMLDGGHIAFSLVELLKGKPLSLGIQHKLMVVGFILLGSLMLLAMFNDFSRLVSSM